MTQRTQKPLPAPAPRFVLCRTCNDRGFTVVHRSLSNGGKKVVVADACPDCAERAESMWRWMREQHQIRNGRLS